MEYLIKTETASNTGLKKYIPQLIILSFPCSLIRRRGQLVGSLKQWLCSVAICTQRAPYTLLYPWWSPWSPWSPRTRWAKTRGKNPNTHFCQIKFKIWSIKEGINFCPTKKDWNLKKRLKLKLHFFPSFRR